MKDSLVSLPSAELPIHHLLDTLYELQQRLLHTGGGKGIELLEKYRGLIEVSNMGRACTYAMKCKNLFMNNDYQEIKRLVQKVMLIMDEMENGG